MTLEKGWHPDPTGRFERRLWNGTRWTSQVLASGVVLTDPYTEPAEPAPEPYEVYVRQRTLRGNTFEYLDRRGATVLRIEQTTWPEDPRLDALLDRGRSVGRHGFEVRDPSTRHLLTLVRPARTDVLLVTRPDGTAVGEIDKDGASTLVMRADGVVVGHVRRGRRRGTAFDLYDAEERTIGRLHKEFAGVMREVFTVSDEYALTLVDPVDEPLRTLALMTPVALDEAKFEVDWAWLIAQADHRW